MRGIYTTTLLVAMAGSVWAQQLPQTPAPDTENTPTILGIFPNHRTVAESDAYAPLTVKQKWDIARRDSFSIPILVQASAYASISQWRDRDPSYGQGAEGFGRRLGAGLADRASEQLLTKAFFPMLLHEDPRYFRRGPQRGSVGNRLGYALSRTFITRTDSGGHSFNFSQLLGQSSSIAVSRLYHTDYQTEHDALSTLEGRYVFHAVGLVLSEFWPDIKHKIFPKHAPKKEP